MECVVRQEGGFYILEFRVYFLLLLCCFVDLGFESCDFGFEGGLGGGVSRRLSI